PVGHAASGGTGWTGGTCVFDTSNFTPAAFGCIKRFSRNSTRHQPLPHRRGGNSMRWPGLIEQYKEWLPVTEATPALTLQEGNTPLVHLETLSEQWRIELYVKLEGADPTGSFKARGMGMAVAKATEEGESVLVCASTVNTSATA